MYHQYWISINPNWNVVPSVSTMCLKMFSGTNKNLVQLFSTLSVQLELRHFYWNSVAWTKLPFLTLSGVKMWKWPVPDFHVFNWVIDFSCMYCIFNWKIGFKVLCFRNSIGITINSMLPMYFKWGNLFKWSQSVEHHQMVSNLLAKGKTESIFYHYSLFYS